MSLTQTSLTRNCQYLKIFSESLEFPINTMRKNPVQLEYFHELVLIFYYKIMIFPSCMYIVYRK